MSAPAVPDGAPDTSTTTATSPPAPARAPATGVEVELPDVLAELDRLEAAARELDARLALPGGGGPVAAP